MSNGKELVNLPVNSITDLATIGSAIAKSCMFGIDNTEAGLVVATTCYQQGISLLDFIRTYHIIDGKPSMKYDAMLSEFRKKGGRVKIIERSNEKAEAEFTFEKQKTIFTLTMEEVKEAGYCFGKGKGLKSNWQQFPKQMLWARLISDAVRTLCPEIVAGLYTPEEMQDFINDKPESKEEIKVVDCEVVAEKFNNSKSTSKSKTTKKRAKKDKKVEKETKIIDAEIIPEDDPFEVADKLKKETSKTDYSICPIEGKSKNEKWEEMPLFWLEKAVKIKAGTKDMEQGHLDYITKVLDRNKDKGE